MTTEIRLPDAISKGSHTSPSVGMCIMETVAYIAGEPHTDHPECACPVITSAAIRLNDSMPDDQTRTRILGPLAFRIAGTRATLEIERERAFIAADWAVRVFAPLELERVGRHEDAARLRGLRRIVDAETAKAAYHADDYAAAYAAAYAADAAYAAAYAADAAADAAADSAAVYAAAFAPTFAAAKASADAKVWELGGRMLEAMIDCDHAAADRAIEEGRASE